MLYDPEANILCWEVSRDNISKAKNFGSFIIHFSKTGKPVIIEILDASSFIGQFEKIKKLKDIKDIKRIVPAGN